MLRTTDVPSPKKTRDTKSPNSKQEHKGWGVTDARFMYARLLLVKHMEIFGYTEFSIDHF